MDEQIINNLNDHLDQIIEQGRGMIDEEALVKQIESGSKKLQDTIRDYPVTSMLIGFAAGYAFARLFTRRK